MSSSSGHDPILASGAAQEGHASVLLRETLDALAPLENAVALDGTFGGGGYSRALLRAGCRRVIGVDRDPDAVARGAALAAADPRFRMIESPFGALEALAPTLPPLDALVLDLGVSSFQLDQAERGFSFLRDGPLDMRMAGASENAGPSAADLLAEADETLIADMIFRYGEERRSRAIARAIVAERARAPIETTARLAAIVERALGGRRGAKTHPATKTFQALRIWVNDELGELERCLDAFDRIAAPGARLAVVSFHSLEDRIAKRFVAERGGVRDAGSRHAPPKENPPPRWRWAVKKPILPSEAETRANPRARSAKLRVAVRLADAERGDAEGARRWRAAA